MEYPGHIVARRVRERRKEQLKITQEELSRRTGIRQGAIARIESGKNRDIETSTLIALAKGLEVSLEYLVGLPEPCKAEEDEDEPHLAGAHA